jgi:hypothetical protein
MQTLKAPFPWFGGKSAVADAVWRRFGTVKNYVEPFFGSGAMLLGRPDWRPGVRLVETVNDADGLLSNFWRALKADPEGVAAAADWPVNEADLHARHLWLVGQREALTDRLMGDPEWYDVRAAGWWVWGASAWIGSGWCSGVGPWVARDGLMVRREQLPHLSSAQGVNRKLPEMASNRGVTRQMPEVDHSRGVHTNTVADILLPVADRIRHVKVACGDWSRITGRSSTGQTGNLRGSAVFLDPPYDEGVGYTGGGGVSADVWAWACEQGGNPLLRIAVCGYEDGREVPPGWRVLPWATGGGYGNQSDDGEGRANARRERVWFSPACIPCEGDIDCATGEPVRVAGGQMGLGI